VISTAYVYELSLRAQINSIRIILIVLVELQNHVIRFSVGDFLAIGKLIADTISALRDSTGSATEYQKLLTELKCLQKALKHLDMVQIRDGCSATNLDSIKLSA